MYGSRKTQNTRLGPPGSRVSRELTGIGLGRGGLRSRPTTALEDDAPPTPAPPSPQSPESSVMRQPSSSSWAPMDDYTRKAREQAKAQLESITGRMFQVLNDYEDTSEEEPAHVKGYLTGLNHQVETIENSELRSNIQMMMTDYNEMCLEREDLLYSLADWFEEDRIDDLLDEAKHRRLSVAVNPEGLRQSLLEGKKASERLRFLTTEMEEAASHGMATDHLQEEKQQLQKELAKSMKVMDRITGPKQDQAAANSIVNDSWKFAAAEICGMLHTVRDHGMADAHELEHKIQEMVASLTQQSQMVEQLGRELRQQGELLKFSELTTSKLSGDNFLLKEELDSTRALLVDSKKTIASMETQLQMRDVGQEGTANSKAPAAQPKVAVTDTSGSQGMSAEVHKAQITDLSKKVAALEKENQELKSSKVSLQKELENTKLELERLQSEPKTDPKTEPGTPSTAKEREGMTPLSSSVAQLNEGLAEQAQILAAKEEALYTEVQNLLQGRQEMERQLSDRQQQLVVAQQETAQLKEVLEEMHAELQTVRNENQQLIKLKDEKAAVVRQTSRALTNSTLLVERDSAPMATMVLPVEPHDIADSDTILHPQGTGGCTPPHSTPIGDTAPTQAHASGEGTLPSAAEVSIGSGMMWNVGGSLSGLGSGPKRDEEFQFTVPTVQEPLDKRRASMSKGQKKAESLDLVSDLLGKLNANKSEFATADSKALKQMQKELQTVYVAITEFLEYSSNLVNDEVEVVSGAVDSLMSHLPEKEKLALDGPEDTGNTAPKPGSTGEQKKMKEKVVHFADQAMEALKAGERALLSKIHAQQEKLQTVVHAMVEHKKKQPQAFKYPLPEDVKGLVLEAHAVSTHALSEKYHKVGQGDQSAEAQRTRMEQLRQYTRNYHQPRPHTGRFNKFFPSQGGLAAGLYGSDMRSFTYAGAAHSYLSGSPEMFGVAGPGGVAMRGGAQLQIDTTHHKEGDDSFSYDNHGPHSHMIQGHHMTHKYHMDFDEHHQPPSTRRKRPKLYKPFNLHHTKNTMPAFLQVGNYGPSGAPPPRTAPSLQGGRRERPVDRRSGRSTHRGERSTGQTGHGTETLSGWRQLRASSRTTFFDLLTHSEPRHQSRHHDTGGDTLKLPSLFRN